MGSPLVPTQPTSLLGRAGQGLQNIGTAFVERAQSRQRRPSPIRKLPQGEEHQMLVDRFIRHYEFLSDQLNSLWVDTRNYWSIYMAQKKDPRGKDERWRANVSLPYAHSVAETLAAAIADLHTISEPLIQVDAIHEKLMEDMRPIQKHLNYILDANDWGVLVGNGARACIIQGTHWNKILWVKDFSRIRLEFGPKDEELFRQKIEEGELATGTKAPGDPLEFEEWRKEVNAATAVKIPDIPVIGEQEVVWYEGPKVIGQQIFDLVYDPFISTVQGQDVFVHRITKPLSWVKKRSGPGKIFDKEAVEEAGAGSENRFSNYERDIAEYMGTRPQEGNDPLYEDKIEILEFFFPQGVFIEGSEVPMHHPMVLNRKVIGNNNPWDMPFGHGQIPFIAVRNISFDGKLLGLADFRLTRPLFKEADTLRSLRLDAVLLATLPVFIRASGAGYNMPEGLSSLKPGAILKAQSVDGIKQLVKNDPGLMSAFREIPEIKNDIDEAHGTYPQIRGAQATVGRVSATESERRVSQAAIRQKMRLMGQERDYDKAIFQMLGLLTQFGSPNITIPVGGSDPISTFPRARLLEAMRQSFRFRSASRAIDNSLKAQMLMQFGTTFAQYFIPLEMRALMKQVYDNFGLRGMDKIISEAGDKLLSGALQPPGAGGAGGQLNPGQPGGDPTGGAGAPAGAQGAPGAPAAPSGPAPVQVLGPDGNPVQSGV